MSDRNPDIEKYCFLCVYFIIKAFTDLQKYHKHEVHYQCMFSWTMAKMGVILYVNCCYKKFEILPLFKIKWMIWERGPDKIFTFSFIIKAGTLIGLNALSLFSWRINCLTAFSPVSFGRDEFIAFIFKNPETGSKFLVYFLIRKVQYQQHQKILGWVTVFLLFKAMFGHLLLLQLKAVSCLILSHRLPTTFVFVSKSYILHLSLFSDLHLTSSIDKLIPKIQHEKFALIPGCLGLHYLRETLSHFHFRCFISFFIQGFIWKGSSFLSFVLMEHDDLRNHVSFHKVSQRQH